MRVCLLGEGSHSREALEPQGLEGDPGKRGFCNERDLPRAGSPQAPSGSTPCASSLQSLGSEWSPGLWAAGLWFLAQRLLSSVLGCSLWAWQLPVALLQTLVGFPSESSQWQASLRRKETSSAKAASPRPSPELAPC